jgi:hypothetical protein
MPYKACFGIVTVEDRNIINTFRFFMNELIHKPFHLLQSHHEKRKNGVNSSQMKFHLPRQIMYYGFKKRFCKNTIRFTSAGALEAHPADRKSLMNTPNTEKACFMVMIRLNPIF